MGKPLYILVLFVLLVFGVSLAVPTEDVQETSSDESESLPYEGTPLSSIDLVRESLQALHVVLIGPCHSGPAPRHDAVRVRLMRRRISDSLTVVDNPLRC